LFPDAPVRRAGLFFFFFFLSTDELIEGARARGRRLFDWRIYWTTWLLPRCRCAAAAVLGGRLRFMQEEVLERVSSGRRVGFLAGTRQNTTVHLLRCGSLTTRTTRLRSGICGVLLWRPSPARSVLPCWSPDHRRILEGAVKRELSLSFPEAGLPFWGGRHGRAVPGPRGR